MNAYNNFAIVWIIGSLTFGCSKDADDPTAPPTPDAGKDAATEHHDEPAHEELPSKVRLPDEVVKAARIGLTKASSAVLPITVELTGELTLDPDASAEVPARAPGRIADVHFKEGQRVRAGALLAVVESPELARARAAFTAAQAKADVGRQNATRVAALVKRGLASGQETASAEADALGLEAEVQAARQTLSAYGVQADGSASAAHLELRAPTSGYVLTRNAMRGQSVDGSTTVAVIADLQRAYFLGRLFEKDLARVKAGASVEVRLNAYPDQVFAGTVESIGRQIDPAARTVVARIAVSDSDDHLKVGLFGAALVSTSESGDQAPHLVVPASAVTRIAGRDVVFVKHADGDFEVHGVSLGRRAESRVEVLSGLREGEEVVTEGVFTLKSMVLKGTFGEDE